MFGNCLTVEGTCHFPTCVGLVNDALFHSFAFFGYEGSYSYSIYFQGSDR